MTKGSITDFAVDIRKGSPTFGKYVSCELSFENKRQLLVPRGFAHGFLVTSSEAVISYKLDNYYHPELERGLLTMIHLFRFIGVKMKAFLSYQKGIAAFHF